MKRSQFSEAGQLLRKLEHLESGIKHLETAPTAKPLLNIAKGAGTDMLESGIPLDKAEILRVLKLQRRLLWADLTDIGIEPDAEPSSEPIKG